MKRQENRIAFQGGAYSLGYYGSGAGDFGGNQCAGRFPAFVSYEI